MKRLMQDRMELTWSDVDIALSVFLKSYSLPQIVQIVEGTYGDDDETTLSSGQQLNLHLVKDIEFFSGLTDSGQEIHIPRSSPHPVSVFLKTKEVQYKSLHELCELFPKKYKYIRFANTRKNPCDPRRIIDAEENLKTLYFDKDTKSLICLDIEGCEISIGLDMLHEVRPLEQIDGLFIAEVYQRYSLPLSVQFMQQGTSSAKLERGMIHLRRVIVKQTVVASTRDNDYKSILTFPISLDVTVLVPQGATEDNQLYRDLCKHLNSEINLRKVEETIENEIYDDVKNLGVKAIPYAKSFFGKKLNKDIKPIEKEKKVNLTDGSSSDDSSQDDDGYQIMDRLPLSPSTKTCDRPLSSRYDSSSSVTSPTSALPKSSPKSSVFSPDAFQSPSCKSYRPAEDDDEEEDEKDYYDYPYFPPAIPRPDVERRYHEPIQTVIKANRKIKDLTVQEVGMLLHDLKLGQYGGIFEREQIDGNMLKDLDKEMLQSHFKMTPFHALKLIKASKENWRPITK